MHMRGRAGRRIVAKVKYRILAIPPAAGIVFADRPVVAKAP
jgi:hypothetical protein